MKALRAMKPLRGRINALTDKTTNEKTPIFY
jgi:hypothetical protein